MATFFQSPSRSPRRVLGDKSTNLTPKRSRAPSIKLHDVDSVKASPFQDMARTKRPPTGPIVTFAGQKRPIDMVEDAERQDGQTAAQKEETMKNGNGVVGGDKEGKLATPTRRFNTMPSFHASQEGPMELEEQFNIQEEMSQGAVDKLNATPLPQVQSSSAFPSFEATEQSQDSQGLSSLIDFDPAEEEVDAKTSPISEKTLPPKDGDARRVMIGQTADLLKARLQLAMYKIKTGQVDKPLSLLQTPSRRSTRSPSLASNADLSPEGRVYAARTAATAQAKPQVASLNAVAAPTLVPTAFSARYMAVDNDEANIPSSPPVADQEDEEDDAATPRQMPSMSQSFSFKEPQTPITPHGRSVNTPDSQASRGVKTLDRKSFNAKNLTSSVIKGEAANGLLELMKMGR